ncbi:MAG: prolyl oligopeptidase family serine peptidase [Clostridia bacterium]|nr:prolyl oligopeptidase family serine peptidase [Clostridia bacterium]
MYEKLYFDNEGGKSFHYLKYTPESEDKQRKLPLVVFMHGAGERGEEDGSELDLVARHGFFKKVARGKEYPFMMVGPQCPKNEYWGSYLESLNSFLDYIIDENNIDTDRIYLTGLSMGGTATWLWALGNPERFAAIAPVCGQGINWYAGKLTDMPVRVYHGDIDEVVSVHESVEMVSSINRKGGHATLKLFHGVKHNAWDYAFEDEMVEWLLQYPISEEGNKQ